MTAPIIAPPAGARSGDDQRIAADGTTFSVHEWRGSGPPTLHVHDEDDEAWHVLEGTLRFRFADRAEELAAGSTVFVPAGVAHTYVASPDARYLVVLTPRLRALIRQLQANRDPEAWPEIYRRHGSRIVE